MPDAAKTFDDLIGTAAVEKRPMTRGELVAGVVDSHESQPGWCYGRSLIEQRIDQGLIVGERICVAGKGYATWLGGSVVQVEPKAGPAHLKAVGQPMLDVLLMLAAYYHSKGSTSSSSGVAQPFYRALGNAWAGK